MITENELRSLPGAYKACLEDMDSSKEAAWTWLRGFIMLFFLPVIWPLVWIVIKLGNWMSK